ncbi:hypothetical protein [Shewanella sp. Actino-trap-3]|nr:hypothetical protein [Shewanella sp. Actino-trap-3]
MTEVEIKILNAIKDSELSVDDAFDNLKELPFKDLGFAMIDNHRDQSRLS